MRKDMWRTERRPELNSVKQRYMHRNKKREKREHGTKNTYKGSAEIREERDEGEKEAAGKGILPDVRVWSV